MDTVMHNLEALFEQLGIENTEEGIEQFLELHKPIPENVALYEAEFWSESQAEFLRESVEDDADWAEVVDHLDAMLRN